MMGDCSGRFDCTLPQRAGCRTSHRPLPLDRPAAACLLACLPSSCYPTVRCCCSRALASPLPNGTPLNHMPAASQGKALVPQKKGSGTESRCLHLQHLLSATRSQVVGVWVPLAACHKIFTSRLVKADGWDELSLLHRQVCFLFAEVAPPGTSSMDNARQWSAGNKYLNALSELSGRQVVRHAGRHARQDDTRRREKAGLSALPLGSALSQWVQRSPASRAQLPWAAFFAVLAMPALDGWPGGLGYEWCLPLAF